MSSFETFPAHLTADETAAMHHVWASCHRAVNAREPYRAKSETRAYLLHPPKSETRRYWLLRGDDGLVVGVSSIAYSTAAPIARVDVAVLPRKRRAGYGRKLLARAVESASQDYAAHYLLLHAIDADGRAFADAIGATRLRADYRQILDLRTAVAHMSQQQSENPSGFEITSWRGSTPDRLLDSYAIARRAIDDAPHTPGGEWSWTTSTVRDLEAAVLARDRELFVHAALDASAIVVAFTELRVSRHHGAVAATEDTAVLPSYRRRGIARWVKTASLVDLAKRRPDVVLVTTTNDSTNTAILALNRRLGFEIVGQVDEFGVEINQIRDLRWNDYPQ
jgi:mycothiol synthase